MDKLSRRGAIASCVTATSVLVAGCGVRATPETANTGRAHLMGDTENVETQTPKAQSREEVVDQLPVYKETPSSNRDYYERANETRDAIWDALEGYDWLVSAGLTKDSDGTWVIIVASEDVAEASRLLPEKWEEIPIQVEKSSGEVKLV